jgi:hypothetical protein
MYCDETTTTIPNTGQEAQKIEGVIEKVKDDSFRILLDTGPETVRIKEVEYVEYS